MDTSYGAGIALMQARRALNGDTEAARFCRDTAGDKPTEALTLAFNSAKDPRISQSFVSVTAADVAKDLSVAKIYYSALAKEDEDLQKSLASAAGYFRSELASRLNLRATPKLIFIRDESAEKAMRISKLLKDIDDGNKS